MFFLFSYVCCFYYFLKMVLKCNINIIYKKKYFWIYTYVHNYLFLFVLVILLKLNKMRNVAKIQYYFLLYISQHLRDCK